MQHQKFGVGFVTDISEGHISIDFEDVDEKILGLDVCVAKGYLKVIEKPAVHVKERIEVNQEVVTVGEINNLQKRSEQNKIEKNRFGWLGRFLANLFKHGKKD